MDASRAMMVALAGSLVSLVVFVRGVALRVDSVIQLDSRSSTLTCGGCWKGCCEVLRLASANAVLAFLSRESKERCFLVGRLDGTEFGLRFALVGARLDGQILSELDVVVVVDAVVDDDSGGGGGGGGCAGRGGGGGGGARGGGGGGDVALLGSGRAGPHRLLLLLL